MARANAKWKEKLHDYEAPLPDTSIDETLKVFTASRKASVPDMWHQQCAVLRHGGCHVEQVSLCYQYDFATYP